MEISVIIICLILSAFFSGMEIAFISSNKIYLEIEKKQDNFISKILTKLTEKPSKFIAAMLIGNNIALVVYGFFMGALLMSMLDSLGYQFSDFLNLLIQTTLSTLVVLITAEFLPKVFFQIYANALIRFFALPAYVFYVLFYFISTFLIWVSDFVLKKFFRTDGDQIQLFFSKVELGNYITEQMSSVEDDEEVDSEIQIFQNALEFSGVRARDIMSPRTELVAIELNDSIGDNLLVIIDQGKTSLSDVITEANNFVELNMIIVTGYPP